MTVGESNVRVESYRTIYNTINSHLAEYVTGWTIVSAYPEVNPVFPSVVINPASVEVTKETLNFGRRSNVITVQIDFYSKSNLGKKSIDSVKDALHDMFITYINELKNGNLVMNDIDDIESDTFIEGEQKINYGGIVANFKLSQ